MRRKILMAFIGAIMGLVLFSSGVQAQMIDPPSLGISHLSVSLSTDTVVSVIPGSGANLEKFNFYANETEDVKINSLTVIRSGGSSDVDFSNIKLFTDGNIQVGQTVLTFTSSKATFPNLNLTISKGYSKTITVRADVGSTFSSTSTVEIGINSASDISAVGEMGTAVSAIIGTFPLNVYTATVAVPSIKVLSPNGGETWTKGTTQMIKWQDNTPIPLCPEGAACAPIAPKYYDIKLLPTDLAVCLNIVGCPAVPVYTIAKNVSGSSYSWSVGDTSDGTISEGAYTIQICQADTTTCDSSDSYFKIVTMLEGILKTDLKVNNSDQPVVPINYGSKFTASWISFGASYCTGYGTDVVAEDGGVWTTGKHPASGSKVLYAKSVSGSVPFSTFHIGLQCWDDSGKSVMDLVGNIPVALPTTGVVPIKDGSIVKIQGIPDVYFIKDGQKVKINSPKEFEEKGYKWDQIQTVQADLLAQIAELKAQVKQLKEDLAKAGALLKSITGNDVYVIKDGKKEKIQDPETFNKRGYKWDQIKSVSQEDLSSIPDFTSTTTQQATTAPALPPGITPGSLVKSSNSPTVYYIMPTGAKRPILNIKVFNSYNNKWDNVKTVSQDEISSSPTVNAIRIGNDPKVYFISNGQKQWVKTPEAFVKQGLKWDQIVSVNKTEFEEYKEGEEIE